MRQIASVGGWLLVAGFAAWDVAGVVLGARVGLDLRTLVRVGTLTGLVLLALGVRRLPSEESRSGLGVGALLAGMMQAVSVVREWGQPDWINDALPALGLLLVCWAVLFVRGRGAYRVAAGGCAFIALGAGLWIPGNVATGAWVWMPGTALIVAGALLSAWGLWSAGPSGRGAAGSQASA